ncbi:hypothetical protein FV226_07640 [Methylobacterium sp. WL12]|uniref:hypothetical protein n=1 Tax=Methylobacterium sp. WL12 TaxID=2603890 RepID=UPI0011CA36CE|nr:hypothetical protein [Methylobacterium sp. WL12]TXM74140.1 hypothetical protein FV226_07640 [Methylobacterium sp. WL12]
MSESRRQRVISEFGSLVAYRAYVTEGRDVCAATIKKDRLTAWTESEFKTLAREADYLLDWKADLTWVTAEIAADEAERAAAPACAASSIPANA